MSTGRRKRVTPRFYFSLRSPYSWLAYRELVDEHPDLAARTEWIPFCEPDELSRTMLEEAGGEFPYAVMSAAKHRYILQDVRRLAAARGLSFRWPVDRDPVWEVPHLGYLAARRHGKGAEFVALAARARWEEGRDICDPATIGSFGPELGMDSAELAGASDDPRLRQEGLEALLAVHRDGVFGVPFFTVHYDKFWGVDRLRDFVAAAAAREALETDRPREALEVGDADRPREALEVVGDADRPRESARLPHGPSFDDGHAGGCG